MNLRKKNGNDAARYLGIAELCSYTSLGKTSARRLGAEAGAVMRFGSRVIYDRIKIDAFLAATQEATEVLE